jgi:hypothetical protein
MLTLILTVAMQAAPAAPVAQVTTCQWPNKCVSAPVAQVQTCVWPHVCVEPVAQVTTCVWPHVCSAKS